MEGSVITRLSSAITQAKRILVVIPGKPAVDTVAAGLGLYLSLTQSGKQVTIASPEPITVDFNRLVSVNKISDQIGSQNLVVSFDYVQDSIEKVSYNINGGRFNLVIAPKPGMSGLDPSSVSYSWSGAGANTVVIVGASRPEQLGRFWTDEQKLFSEASTINFDINPQNMRFAKINLIDPQSSSLSELVGLVLRQLSLPESADIATNLLAGIEIATQNFSRHTRPETFETIAWCLRSGGRRGQLQVATPKEPFDSRPYMGREEPRNTPRPRIAPQPQPQPQPRNPIPPTFQQKKQSSDTPAPEWLKPKIYKGSSPVE